jgi:hypothetical protein
LFAVRRPAVSTSENFACVPSAFVRERRARTGSRVVPATSLTMRREPPSRRLPREPLADVRTTGEGEADGARPLFAGRLRLGAEQLEDERLELRDAAPVFGRDEERLAEAESEELGHQPVALLGVGLVRDHDHLLAGLAELRGDLEVERGAAFGGIDDEQHERGGGEGEVHLLLDGVGHDLGRQLGAVQADAAGVHEGVAAFEDVGRDQVTGDARLVVHDRDAPAHEPVEQAASCRRWDGPRWLPRGKVQCSVPWDDSQGYLPG